MPRTRTRHRSAIFAHAAQQWALMRTDWSRELEHRYARAVVATNCVLLNERGRSRGVSEWDLFVRGPAYRAAYASEELVEHLEQHPIPTLAEFEQQWHDSHERNPM